MAKFHLCLIINRFTDEVIAEHVIENDDWHSARHIVADGFLKIQPQPESWYVDSYEIDKDTAVKLKSQSLE